MHAAHKKFGIAWKGSHKGIHRPHPLDAVADSGCQTCSAGVDVLQKIGVPISYLVPTSHRIVGITESLLDISGSLLLRIEVAGKITRQMVHVSTNTQGLYLSESALKELGLLAKDFPNHLHRSNFCASSCATHPTNCLEGGSENCVPRYHSPTSSWGTFSIIPRRTSRSRSFFTCSFQWWGTGIGVHIRCGTNPSALNLICIGFPDIPCRGW